MTELALVRENPAPQSLEDWKTYIAAASAIEAKVGHALVEAIIEKGRRIAEFYAAYKARGQRWGDRWDDVCKNTIGMSDDMCRRYMIVAENVPKALGAFLPTALETLYCLSSIARKDAPAFDAAVVAGEINPKTTTVKAKALAERIHGRKPRAVRTKKNEQKITIAIPVEDVIDKLRPLIKRVKEQSDRHAATVSFMALRIIAHELKQLADSWMKNGPESGTHSEPVPLNSVRKGG